LYFSPPQHFGVSIRIGCELIRLIIWFYLLLLEPGPRFIFYPDSPFAVKGVDIPDSQNAFLSRSFLAGFF